MTELTVMQQLRTRIKELDGKEFTARDMKGIKSYNARIMCLLKSKEIKLSDSRAVYTDRKVDVYVATSLLREPMHKELSSNNAAVKSRDRRARVKIKNKTVEKIKFLSVDKLAGIRSVYPELFKKPIKGQIYSIL